MAGNCRQRLCGFPLQPHSDVYSAILPLFSVVFSSSFYWRENDCTQRICRAFQIRPSPPPTHLLFLNAILPFLLYTRKMADETLFCAHKYSERYETNTKERLEQKEKQNNNNNPGREGKKQDLLARLSVSVDKILRHKFTTVRRRPGAPSGNDLAVTALRDMPTGNASIKDLYKNRAVCPYSLYRCVCVCRRGFSIHSTKHVLMKEHPWPSLLIVTQHLL